MADNWSGLVAALFSGLHVWAGRIRFLSTLPRSLWLSGAGGISIAYVFLHLLPELGRAEKAVRLEETLLERGAYLAAMLGLCLFYGLERLAITSRRQRRARSGQDRTPPAVFALHVAAFALYNLLIGYLLVHGNRENLGLYAAAMGVHFLVNDQALRQHHKEQYDSVGRWVLAAAVFAGWWLALRVQLPEAIVHLALATLAGAVILNVVKEELPEERGSRFWAFLAGAAAYGVVLLLL